MFSAGPYVLVFSFPPELSLTFQAHSPRAAHRGWHRIPVNHFFLPHVTCNAWLPLPYANHVVPCTSIVSAVGVRVLHHEQAVREGEGPRRVCKAENEQENHGPRIRVRCKDRFPSPGTEPNGFQETFSGCLGRHLG